MSFSETLKEAVDKVDGALSAMIISSDGMPVEEYAVHKLLNLDDLSAEASQMIKNIGIAAETLGIGEAKEFSIVSDLCGIIMRKINNDYYIGLIIKPDGNYGKGRFILKTLVPRIENEF